MLACMLELESTSRAQTSAKSARYPHMALPEMLASTRTSQGLGDRTLVIPSSSIWLSGNQFPFRSLKFINHSAISDYFKPLLPVMVQDHFTKAKKNIGHLTTETFVQVAGKIENRISALWEAKWVGHRESTLMPHISLVCTVCMLCVRGVWNYGQLLYVQVKYREG